MSYCRAYDRRHEIYLYHDVKGVIVCCGCPFGTRRCKTCGRVQKWVIHHHEFSKRSEAIKHLLKHRRYGHQFPLRVVTQLRREIRELGDTVK